VPRITLATLLLVASSACAQQSQTVTFLFPDQLLENYGVEALYGWFGDEAVGGQITSARLYLAFETSGDFDAALIHTQFVVPTLGENSVWELAGADLGWSGPGQFSAMIETSDFNGEVRSGKYSWILDAGIDGPGISGRFLENSRYEFDVQGQEDCYADFNGDGVLDLFDFLEFVNAFNAEQDRADCEPGGALDLFDFLCWVSDFDHGC
jgi:hypothetical protein